VYLGAALIALSLLIMVGLLSRPDQMREVMPFETWFILSALLAPIGYVLQDVVADAMTVEAVPRIDEAGQPIAEEEQKLGHATMQTLGRVAVIGGAFLVSIVNVVLFSGVESMNAAQKAAVYLEVYELALIIPVVSVLGVLLAGYLRRRRARQLRAQGVDGHELDFALHGRVEKTHVNWWILGGGLLFGVFSVAVGVSRIEYGQEIIFLGSMAVIVFLMLRLVRELEPGPRNTLVGTAFLIFVFRASSLMGPGEGATWWMIDVLGFDQQFLAKLGAIATGLTLAGLFLFRRMMGERSIVYIIAFLTVAGLILALPNVAMFYGLHHWTAAHTGGVVDQRFIAVINTSLASPLEQVAMIPMLAWIANSAPGHLKATYFAVMASFTNLALSLAQLGTKYLNTIFTVAREVKDAATGALVTPADYSQLGMLLITVVTVGFVTPMLAILFVKFTRFRSA
jgi:hypothetical protein